jgi:hypothetical protein
MQIICIECVAPSVRPKGRMREERMKEMVAINGMSTGCFACCASCSVVASSRTSVLLIALALLQSGL